jgi:hypothetical protein
MTDAVRKQPSNLRILSLTFAFFGAGMLLLLAASVAAIWFVPDLVELHSLRNPKGWFLAHLLLLGWATMLAMGASYQIVQIVLHASLYSRGLGIVHGMLYMSGLAALLFGFFADGRLIAAGGILVTLGVLCYAINLIVTFIRARAWNIFVFGISLSLASLIATVLLGVKMGLGFAYGWHAGTHEQTLSSHLWFGIGGWLAGLILVFGLKLLPMFMVSRWKTSRALYAVIGGFHLGLWLEGASLWFDGSALSILAAGMLILALAGYSTAALDIRRQSRAKQPIGAVHAAYWLLPLSFLLYLCWFIVDRFAAIDRMWNEAFLIYLVLGWFTGSILCYLSKILPFLWWAHRFRTKEEKKGAILLSAMLPEKRLTVEMVGYLFGVAVVATGFLAEWPLLAMAGQALSAGMLLVYVGELLRVFRH